MYGGVVKDVAVVYDSGGAFLREGNGYTYEASGQFGFVYSYQSMKLVFSSRKHVGLARL